MNTQTHTPTTNTNPIAKRVAVLTAAALALCGAISGIIQITHEQSSQTTVVGIEHVTITCFALMVLLMIPVTHYFAGITGRRLGAWIVTAGAIPLTALATSSNIRGEDFDFFPAVAIPTNLAILVGLIVTAVALRRHSNAPAAIVFCLPLTWLLGLPMSSLGIGIVLAGYWTAVAWLIENDRISAATRSTRGAIAPAVSAAA